MPLSKDELLKAYRMMKTIREFEERLHVEFATGEIPGFVHLYAGEEASATGFCMHLDERDKIASNHRGHGHSIGKGCDVHAMMAEIYGRGNGICGGKGGSMHIADLSKGMMGANGIVGGGSPLACGAALAAKQLGTKGDAQTYRGKDEVKNLRATIDCLDKFRAKVTSAELLSEAELNAIDSEVAVLIDDSVLKAKAAPIPAPAELLTDVYISY
jgi:pyruvate dehydrogenase E1 component alpha subunit